MKHENVFSLKLFGTAVILCMTAFSCTNNDTTDSAPPTTDTSASAMAIDTPMMSKTDTTASMAATKPGSAKPNPAKKGMKGKVSITPTPAPAHTAETKMEADASGVYTNVETSASFTGGNEAMQKYFNNNLEYPAQATNEGVEGTVTLSFIVDEKGKIRSPEVVGGNLGYGLDEEAIRVLNSMPKWSPAKVKGQNVKTRLTLPVRFVLE